MNQEFKIFPTGSKIFRDVRLLVFQIGRYKMSAVIDQVRTIIDLHEGDDNLLYESDYNCSYTSGNITVNCVDLNKLIFPNEFYEPSLERKLIIVKTSQKTLNGILVDRIEGVGMFNNLYPFPQGSFKLQDGVFSYVVSSEEPWFEVVDLAKIIEIYNYQPAKVENV